MSTGTKQPTLDETETIEVVQVGDRIHGLRMAITVADDDGDEHERGLAACDPTNKGQIIEIPLWKVDQFENCNAPACPGGDDRC